MSEPDVQYFDSDGTWVKPPGAVRLAVSLKGGDGDNSVGAVPRALTFFGAGGGATFGGQGGSASAGPPSSGAGGGAGGQSAGVSMDLGTVTRAPEWNVTPGVEGQLVEFSFAADEVPDRMAVKIGQGGWARVVTDLENGRQ